MVQNYILLFIGAALVNNIVLVKILGLCPFMGVSKKLEASVAMAMATAFVLTIGSGTSYFISEYLLGTDLFYLRTVPKCGWKKTHQCFTKCLGFICH